ncbi:MAG: hypothetical protein M1840_001458 [Geoglossum simile]|nr:MAG: hypothetical protein M1840_001458 [Geoglossum simile]
MPSLLGRQASRALYSLSHNLLRDSIFPLLRYPCQVRRLHDNSVLYPGSPSYTTFARRFSSKPNPTSCFVQKRPDVAKANDNFVDIYDAESADTKDTNTLMMDVDNDILYPKISKLKLHAILPRLLSIGDKAHRTISDVDSQALPMCIPTQVVQAFGLGGQEGFCIAKIAGHLHPVHTTPPKLHFTGISLSDGFHAMPSGQCYSITPRLSSRQASRTLYNLSHNLPRSFTSNPLCYPQQARHLHDMSVPYSGPASYVTLTRRFSLKPNPITFFAQEWERRDIENGNFVDIHDASSVGLKDYDMIITDVDNGILQSEISELAGLPYLKEAKRDEADDMPDKLFGFIYGENFRMMLPCLVGIGDKARWVFFIVDSGTPRTFISAQAAQAFGLDERRGIWVAKIAGHLHPVYLTPPKSHFTGINILGGDFCTLNEFHPWVNSDRTVIYYIGKKWKVGCEP